MVNGPYQRDQYPYRPGYHSIQRLGGNYVPQEDRITEDSEWSRAPMVSTQRSKLIPYADRE